LLGLAVFYKATGKSLDARVCHGWKLKGSRSFQQYVDTEARGEVPPGDDPL